MTKCHLVGDFMVRNPVCGFLWQPLSFLRQTMLVNSFSFLPVPVEIEGKTEWRLISDFGLARHLRKKGKVSKEALTQRLQDAVNTGQIELVTPKFCRPQDMVQKVLEESNGLPTLVLSQGAAKLLGIIAPFDML